MKNDIKLYHVTGVLKDGFNITPELVYDGNLHHLKTLTGHSFIFNKKTVIPCKIPSGESFECVITNGEDDDYQCLLMLPSLIWEMFSSSDKAISEIPEEKRIRDLLRHVESYCSLDSDKRQAIFRQRFLPDIHHEAISDPVYFTMSDCRFLSEILHNKLSDQQLRFIREALNQSPLHKDKAKDAAIRYMFNTLPTLPYGEEQERYSHPEELLEEWNQLYYARISEKRNLLEYIAASSQKSSRSRRLTILLVGAPGTGKTYFADTFAHIIGRPCEKLFIGNMSSVLDLVGCSRTYSDSAPGRVAEAFMRARTTDIVVVLEDVGRASTVNGRDGNLESALFEMLSSNYFTDDYYGVPVSTENTIFIGTTNTIQGMSDSLINKFDEVINFPEFSIEELIDASKKILIPNAEAQYSFCESIQWTDGILRRMIRYYCGGTGVRGIKRGIDRVYEHFAARICEAEEKKKTRLPFKIDEGKVDELLATEYMTPEQKIFRNRDYFSQDEWNNICTLIDESGNRTDVKRQEDAIRVTELIADMIPETPAEPSKVDTIRLRNGLDAKLFGMREAKAEICRYVWSRTCSLTAGSKTLLLHGAPGTGKTSLAFVVAKLCGIPLVKISIAGLDVKTMAGLARQFNGSHPGMIVSSISSAMRAAPNKRGVLLLLDEADKAVPETATRLATLLDDSECMWTDDYVGFPTRLPICFTICTANDITKIPPFLLSRMEPVHVDTYTFSEKMAILERYMLPETEKNYANSIISLEKEALKLLVRKSNEGGVRDLKHNLAKVVETKGAEENMSVPFHMNITREDIKAVLGTEQKVDDSLQAVPGIVMGLGITGRGKGSLSPIQAVCYKSEGKPSCEALGNVTQVIKESAQIGFDFLRLHNLIPADKDIKVYYRAMGVQKDGGSSGAAMALAMYLAAKNMSSIEWYGAPFALTGEIAVDGSIMAVGGVHEKVSAAAEDGYEAVFVPADTAPSEYAGFEDIVVQVKSFQELMIYHNELEITGHKTRRRY